MNFSSLKVLFISLCVSSAGFSSDPSETMAMIEDNTKIKLADVKDTMSQIAELKIDAFPQLGSVGKSYDEGFQAGVENVKANHYSFGLYELNSSISAIIEEQYSDRNSTYYKNGYDLGYKEGNQSVYENLTEYNLLRLEEFDKSAMNILADKKVSSMPYTTGWFYVADRGWLFTNSTAFPWFYEPNHNDFMVLDKLDGNTSFYHPKFRNWISVKKEEITFPIYHFGSLRKNRISLKSMNQSRLESLRESGLSEFLIFSLVGNNDDLNKTNNFNLYQILNTVDLKFGNNDVIAQNLTADDNELRKLDLTKNSDGIGNAIGVRSSVLLATIVYGENYKQGKVVGKNDVTSNYQKYGFGKLSEIQDLIDKELEIKYANSVKSGKMKGFSDAVESVLKNDYSLVNKDFLSDFNTTQEIKDSPYTNGWFYQTEVGWRWTDKTTYPYIYDQNTGGWLYFISDSENALLFEYDSKSWKNVE